MNDVRSNRSTYLATDGAQIQDPASYAIEYIRLYPNNNPGFTSGQSYCEIGELVSKIEIVESIFQASVVTNIFLRDATNMIESFRISGNEKIEIKIFQDIVNIGKKEFDYTCYISDIINYSKPAISSQAFQIQAVSEHAYLNQLTTLNEPFKGTAQELATKICTSHLGLSGDFGSGGMIMKGIYPNLKPVQAINWLARNAFDNGSSYFFWEQSKNKDRKGKQIKFNSYEDLVSQEPIEEYNNDPFYTQKERNDPQYYKSQVQKIKKMASDLNLSKYNDAPKGAYVSTLYSIDISTKERIPKKVHQYNDDVNKLNEFKPFSDNIEFGGQKLIDHKTAKKLYVNRNSLAFGSTPNYHEHEVDNIQQSLIHLANLEFMSHRLTLAGNTELCAGAVINLKIWKSVSPDRLEGSGDELLDGYMSGKYLISKVTHVFDQTEYFCLADVFKDSQKLDFDKEIKL